MPGGQFEDELKQLKIEFLPVDISRRASLKPIRQIKDIMRNKKIDLVHSQGARADFFTRVAARIVGVSHILCTVAMPVEGFDIGPLRKKIYRFMDRLTERYVQCFIVVSDSLKQFLIERRGIPANQIVRIYNGIEVDQYHPGAEYGNFRKELGMPQDAPLLGAVGRMVWQKGFKYLIQAVRHIAHDAPHARFLLIGEGPLRYHLEKLALNLNQSEKIIFTGFRSDIANLLYSLDLLVVPSLLEGFPMVTLEAMAMAKPIIATNIDGITEQITHGKDGILVPPKDASAISKAIVRVLSDKEASRKMGLAARKKVEQEFSVEKMVRETEQVYLSLLT